MDRPQSTPIGPEGPSRPSRRGERRGPEAEPAQPTERPERPNGLDPLDPLGPHAADRELCDRALAGDREAAETLFRRHFDGLYDFVHYRAGGERSLVEDLVQDTLLVALDRLASYDGRASLHTWLCGIARNKLSEHRRKRRPRPLADVLLDADDEILDVLARVEAEPLPDWALQREETRALVGASLSSLSPEYRQALTAKYVDGMSVREIGALNGRGEKATESMLTRARKAFGDVLGLLARRSGGDPGEPWS